MNLFNTKVTDNGLECLKGVPQLERLEVGGATAVTEAGIEGLQQALPKCKVYH